jgi:hypothetical protein
MQVGMGYWASKVVLTAVKFELFTLLAKEPLAMTGIQTGNFVALVNKLDFSQYNTLFDVGGADGWLSIQTCLKHPQHSMHHV